MGNGHFSYTHDSEQFRKRKRNLAKTIGDFFNYISKAVLKPKNILANTYVTNVHCQILIPVHMNQNKFK